MGEVHIQTTEGEENTHQNEDAKEAKEDDFHGDVALGTQHFRFFFGSTFLTTEDGAEGGFDNTRRLDNAENAGHSDAANADVFHIIGENFLRSHRHNIDSSVLTKQGHNDPPREERTGADDGSVLQSNQIAGTKQDARAAHIEDELVVVGQRIAPCHPAGGNGFGPELESGGTEVVQATNQTTEQQQFKLFSTFSTRNKNFGGGGGFGEGVLAVHIRNEVLAEGDQEKDAEEAAEEGGEEDLEEVDIELDAWVAFLDDVDGGKCEDGTRYNHTGTGADGLDDDIFGERAFTLRYGGCPHSDDGNRDSRFKHLPETQSGIGSCRRKDNRHQNSPNDSPGIDFRILLCGKKYRFVLFALFEFAIGVVRNLHLVFGSDVFFIFFHFTLIMLKYEQLISFLKEGAKIQNND